MKWWGYLHVNGDIHVKRALLGYHEDVIEASASPFVKLVFPNFLADGRDEAIHFIKGMLAAEEQTKALTPLQEVLAAGELLDKEITRLAREYGDRSVELDVCFATRNWHNIKVKYEGRSNDD